MDKQELEQEENHETSDLSTICSFCGKPISIRENQLYCYICGCPVINRCSDTSCNTYLFCDDHFCYVCGKESIFLKENLIKSEYNYRTGERPINPRICINNQHGDCLEK